MLSKKEIICPENLLKIAKTKGSVKVVIVNAGKSFSMQSAKEAVEEGLIDSFSWRQADYRKIIKGN